MKHLILIVMLLMLNIASALANNDDSAKADIKVALIEAGWMRDWRGEPTQWTDIHGVRAEVTGYVSVNRRIRLYKNNAFEIDVYQQPNYTLQDKLENGLPCPSTHSDIEVSVITGKWSVKEDSIYLIYKRENIYNLNEYSEYQSTLGSSEEQKRPKVLRDCRFKRKETYVWSDRKMCLADAMEICFK